MVCAAPVIFLALGAPGDQRRCFQSVRGHLPCNFFFINYFQGVVAHGAAPEEIGFIDLNQSVIQQLPDLLPWFLRFDKDNFCLGGNGRALAVAGEKCDSFSGADEKFLLQAAEGLIEAGVAEYSEPFCQAPQHYVAEKTLLIFSHFQMPRSFLISS